MIREIVLDTETTGFDPAEGHRLVEIGCLELVNHVRTGRTFQTYLNPQRDVPPDAARVHGLTTAFLADKPLFTEQVDALLEFIGDDRLVIHNAEFDVKFLNAELKSAGLKPLSMARVTDTVLLARQKFPGQPANLDALCRRFKVDNSNRKFHGALLDSELLAEVYLALLGGRQHGFALGADNDAAGPAVQGGVRHKQQDRPHRAFPPSAEDLARHKAFVAGIKNSLWAAREE
jgi:DNA polymerase III subunit epsilon